MFFYFMHFPLPIVVGFVFWLRSREHYRRFIAALLLMCVSLLHHLSVLAVAPPWYQFGRSRARWPGGAQDPQRDGGQVLGRNYVVTPIYTHLNPNQFAAFPSLHAAFPARPRSTLGGDIALSRSGWSSGRLAVVVSIVYLGEHYVVDALDRSVYVAVAAIIVEALSRRRARRAASATPATPSA